MSVKFSYDGLDILEVQALDPLHADGAVRALPAMNVLQDVSALCGELRRLMPSLEAVQRFSPLEQLAAMRDLGMFLGSIKRHGIEPLSVVGEIEPILLELGRQTDMVPRDTVHHYIVWNPTGERERTYTDHPMEVKLMGSVRLSLPALGVAVGLCERMLETDLFDPEFVTLSWDLADRLKVMETTIDMVLEHVSPAFFARDLRPYFIDIRVGGRSYLGPAAAHVPLFLIDLALWASDNIHPEYEGFWRESAEFALPAWRSNYERWHRQPSLVSRVMVALRTSNGKVSPQLRFIASALKRMLRTLVIFRGRHLRIAREAYSAELRLFELGSGGGSVALLSSIMQLTHSNAQLVRNALAAKRASAVHASAPGVATAESV